VEEGLRRDPDSAVGQFVLGSIYERTGKFPEAEHALRQALQLDAKMSNVHLELVNLYLAQQKKSEAKAELEVFLKSFPNDPMVPKVREVLAKLERSIRKAQ
jgi:Tfp pilus assembly protein PilF